MNRIYLDYNATSPLLPEVTEAMVECYRRYPGNPASQHRSGREAHRVLEDAREEIADMLGARLTGRQADRLVFTSGGTESNNLAVLGIAGAAPTRHAQGIVISAIEHPSVESAAAHLTRSGWSVRRLGVTQAGVVRFEEIDDILATRPALVSVMLASNETGVVQPVAEIAERCRAAGVLMHTDAVQVVGKLPVEFRKLGVATMSIAAHKFHGPRGIGALILRHDVALAPVMFGGLQQDGLRPGTEPVALAVGMRAALEAYHRERDQRARRMSELRDRFEAALQASLSGLVINGGGADRLPHVSNVAFVGLDRQALMVALDLAGVECSTGSACASGSSEPSPVLRAMGCDDRLVSSSLRFSLGATTTEAEIDEAIRRIGAVCGRMAGTGRLAFQDRVPG